MAETEKEYLLRCNAQGICPKCGEPVTSGNAVGSGRLENGRFCSLDCYGSYYQQELKDRHEQRLRNGNGKKDG